MDTQSAGFYVLIFTLHHAYPRVEKGEGHQERTWYAHRRTCKHEKQHIAPSTFRLQSGLAGTRDATDAAPPEPPETRGRRTRAAWWSPPTCGAATVAFERRLAAPDRLAGDRHRRSSSEKSTDTYSIERRSAESTPATSAPTTVVMAVGLAGLCSSRLNARQCEGCAAAGSAGAGDDIRQGKVDVPQRAGRRGEAERAPGPVAAAVPPVAKDVLRCPLRPQPATCECRKRDDTTHALYSESVRLHCQA